MGYEYAIAIEYLTDGKMKAEHLVPEKVKILRKLGIRIDFVLNKLTIKQIPIALIVALNDCSNEIDNTYQLAKDIGENGLLRPIAVDENNNLIFGKESVTRINFDTEKIYKCLCFAAVLSI